MTSPEAYCIRLENIHVDKLAHSGVCDTPLRLAPRHAGFAIRIAPHGNRNKLHQWMLRIAIQRDGKHLIYCN